MHHIIKRLQSALSFVGPLMPASWIVHAGLHLLPRIGKVRDWYDSLDWCEQQMRQRVVDSELELGASNRDLSYYLMEQERGEAGKRKAKDRNVSWLGGDSLLAIIAGRYAILFHVNRSFMLVGWEEYIHFPIRQRFFCFSPLPLVLSRLLQNFLTLCSDPSTSTLIGAFCELGRNPDQAEKVFQEVSLVDDINDIQQLRKLHHLGAVINETMRLYPALLSGGSRKTSSKGLTIAGQFIPPFTTTISPRYTIGRSKLSGLLSQEKLLMKCHSCIGGDCFEDPGKFVPERWTTLPNMIRNSAAFSPFGTGKPPQTLSSSSLVPHYR